MPTTEQLRTRLIDKLKELFQLDQPDLDFGFYRIMHAKSKQVTEFLENDLLKIVSQAFGEAASGKTQQALAAARQKVEQALGANAIDEHGAINDAFSETPAGKEYKTAFEKAHVAQDTAQAEGDVYDHLYRFFERYYEDADFISRRYSTRETDSKAAPFAIPYCGEEVKLHWANADQYYIKTSEHFTNFTVDLRHTREIVAQQAELGLGEDQTPVRVHFRLVDAVEGEHGNVKPSDASRRFFILHENDPVGFDGQGDLEIRLEYRADAEKTGQDAKWQEKRRDDAVAKIIAAIQSLDGAEIYRRLLSAKAPTESNRDRTVLAKFLYQYTARNTCDYFIHKDLGGFLRRELDFYIKNEVMRLDDIEDEAAPGVEHYLGKIKVMRRIAHELIGFLEQLEDFQKRLWLKKKFVLRSDYCITLDRVPKSLYAEVAANAAQRKGWVDLFAINTIVGEELGQVAYSDPLTVAFLESQPHLVLDTACFAEDFKARLLSSIQDITQHCSGLAVHSDNFQAMQMLRQQYRGLVNYAFIDPPYNTGQDDFTYKDSYQHSSWLAMMVDRLRLARHLMDKNGLHATCSDYVEVGVLRLVSDFVFGPTNFLADVSWEKRYTRSNNAKKFYSLKDSIHCYSVSQSLREVKEKRTDKSREHYSNPDNDTRGDWISSSYVNPATREERPNLCYPITNPFTGAQVEHPTHAWKYDAETHREHVTEQRLYWGQNGEYELPRLKTFLQDASEGMVPVDVWGYKDTGTTDDGGKELKALFGEDVFSNPKPTSLVTRFCNLMANGTVTKRPVICDYFAGSGTTGHAAIAMSRANGGAADFLLVEMGNYFDTVLKPRLQKVVYSAEWKDGKPVSRTSGLSHCFKYIRLESYEDALNNLCFADDPVRDEALRRNPDLRKDYMLRYMLDVETRGSQSLLNIQAFTDPTAYTLKIKKPGSDEYEERPVDLLETFNYLIGLRVEHIAAPQRFNAKFKREVDPELPGDTQTRLVIDGRFETAEDGKWWFRKVEGWVPSNPEHPNNGHKDKVLIVWRNLPSTIERGAEGMEEDNLMMDEWFKKNRISTRDFEFDTIYVNGSNNLPNLQQEGDKWKVRLIEEDFMKRMWDVEDV